MSEALKVNAKLTTLDLEREQQQEGRVKYERDITFDEQQRQRDWS